MELVVHAVGTGTIEKESHSTARTNARTISGMKPSTTIPAKNMRATRERTTGTRNDAIRFYNPRRGNHPRHTTQPSSAGWGLAIR